MIYIVNLAERKSCRKKSFQFFYALLNQGADFPAFFGRRGIKADRHEGVHSGKALAGLFLRAGNQKERKSCN